MVPTCPLSPNKCNGSELPNAGAMNSVRHITWPTSVSIYDKTLKGGKIHVHRYNDIREIDFFSSSSSSSSLNGLAQNWYKYLP